MAKQLITIGTPGAGGGDPAHLAFKKINDNATELYDAAIPDTEAKKAQARTNLGLGGAAVEDLMPVSKGGTGSNGPWGARNNIGALGVGDFGLGAEGVNINESNINTLPNGFYGMNSYPGFYGYGSALRVISNPAGGSAWKHNMFFPAINLSCPEIMTNINNTGWFGPHPFLIKGRNAVVDGNGFIKAASPVGDLYADRIELNDAAKKQPITFEKLGVGDYLIKGSLGFAQTSWYVEQPKDANGNVYHAVVYDTLENGDLSIKTYERKLEGINIVADLTKPVDIKENRFISIRLHEEPKAPTSSEINPDLLDNEGSPAPSEYHTLEGGVWTVTAEYAEVLEQRRLESMKPLKRRQFRLTLAMNGYDLKEVEILIDQIEDPMQRTIAQIEWQDAGDFERTNPTLLMMAGLLGLDTAAVDQLWEYGLML